MIASTTFVADPINGIKYIEAIIPLIPFHTLLYSRLYKKMTTLITFASRPTNGIELKSSIVFRALAFA